MLFSVEKYGRAKRNNRFAERLFPIGADSISHPLFFVKFKYHGEGHLWIRRPPVLQACLNSLQPSNKVKSPERVLSRGSHSSCKNKNISPKGNEMLVNYKKGGIARKDPFVPQLFFSKKQKAFSQRDEGLLQ
jgi:hypothetical protein